MAEIRLTPHGDIVLINDTDLELVQGYCWNALRKSDRIYAHGYRPGHPTVLMHRLLIDAPQRQVDHINGNGLDNRRANLRPVTNGQNRANSRPSSASGYKGVTASGNRWRAYGMFNRRQTYLGSFGTPEEAAQAYDAWAVTTHGEYARLNFPNQPAKEQLTQ